MRTNMKIFIVPFTFLGKDIYCICRKIVEEKLT